MNNSIDIVDFTLTPNEKTIGIATVRFYDKILLRYKVLPNKDGTGFFSAPFSYKTKKDDQDFYVPIFVIDSKNEENTIKSVIHDWVKRTMSLNQEIPF